MAKDPLEVCNLSAWELAPMEMSSTLPFLKLKSWLFTHLFAVLIDWNRLILLAPTVAIQVQTPSSSLISIGFTTCFLPSAWMEIPSLFSPLNFCYKRILSRPGAFWKPAKYCSSWSKPPFRLHKHSRLQSSTANSGFYPLAYQKLPRTRVICFPGRWVRVLLF